MTPARRKAPRLRAPLTAELLRPLQRHQETGSGYNWLTKSSQPCPASVHDDFEQQWEGNRSTGQECPGYGELRPPAG